jgi:hypothetical protein
MAFQHVRVVATNTDSVLVYVEAFTVQTKNLCKCVHGVVKRQNTVQEVIWMLREQGGKYDRYSEKIFGRNRFRRKPAQ